MRVSDLTVALRRIEETNWDLEGAWTSQDLHDLHWYPATYPPQLPRLLVSLFSQPSAHVLDPFCGSGTTLLESIKAQRYATGIECNPVGAMIADAKLLRCSPAELMVALKEVRTEVRDAINSLSLFELERSGPVEADGCRSEVSNWYHPKTHAELVALWRICSLYHDDVGRLLRCVFSAILKSASAQNEHWGYIADNMRPKTRGYKSAKDLFLRKLDRLVRQLDSLSQQMSPWGVYERYAVSSRVIHGDVRTIGLPRHSVDLVLTSPPYAGVTDYARSQRLSFEWFGWALEDSERCEIGARWKRRRKTSSSDYTREMAAAMKCVADALRPGAMCIFVIGQSSVRDGDQQITRSMVHLMSEVGLSLVTKPLYRERSRQRLVNREAKPSEEALYVFQKGRS